MIVSNFEAIHGCRSMSMILLFVDFVMMIGWFGGDLLFLFGFR